MKKGEEKKTLQPDHIWPKCQFQILITPGAQDKLPTQSVLAKRKNIKRIPPHPRVHNEQLNKKEIARFNLPRLESDPEASERQSFAKVPKREQKER